MKLAGIQHETSFSRCCDCTVPRQLVAAGQLLDVPLHDHVIIAGYRFTSFAAQGLL
jgi:DNA repair protein RadC